MVLGVGSRRLVVFVPGSVSLILGFGHLRLNGIGILICVNSLRYES